MKKFLLSLFAVIAIGLVGCQPAYSQQLKVSTGGAKGTYASEFAEMQNACGNELALVGVPSSGAVENLNRLVGNEVNAAFVQSDLLYRRARNEDLGNVKTLLALHPEQLHFVTLNTVRKVGGTLGFGAKEFTLNDIGQLTGLRLAAAGGSVETAKQVRLDTEISYTLVETATADLALAALKGGTADAALLVGGAPLGNLKELGVDYKLLTVPSTFQEKLKGAYKPARVSYAKMNASGVPTVAIDALLVTREYKTAAMVGALGKFRNCVLSKIDELKETTGTHPAWQTVDPANRGKWAWYDLPAAAPGKK